MIERLSRWSALGGCEGDPEWALLESLSRPEREALECELNRIDASIQQLKAKLRRRDDDLYRS